MRNRTVFVLLDGLQSRYAKEHLGYLEHCVEANRASKYEVLGELPSSSRPMYETIFTGVPVIEHGITNNGVIRLSNQCHLFQLLKQANKKSLALAYYWISELYLSAPFDMSADVYHEDPDSCIDRGFFYYDDIFPDSHLYSLASGFMKEQAYDFVLIHPMGIDDAGHRFGAGSKEYSQAVIQNDKLLSTYIPQWIDQDYNVVVAADHGMSELGYHGGNSLMQRQTALYILSDRVKPGSFDKMLTTLDMAPLLCRLTDVQPGSEMKQTEVAFNDQD